MSTPCGEVREETPGGTSQSAPRWAVQREANPTGPRGSDGDRHPPLHTQTGAHGEPTRQVGKWKEERREERAQRRMRRQETWLTWAPAKGVGKGGCGVGQPGHVSQGPAVWAKLVQ